MHDDASAYADRAATATASTAVSAAIAATAQVHGCSYKTSRAITAAYSTPRALSDAINAAGSSAVEMLTNVRDEAGRRVSKKVAGLIVELYAAASTTGTAHALSAH
jgi:hypothetical protein